MKVTENKQVTYDLKGLSEEEARALVVALAAAVAKGTSGYAIGTVTCLAHMLGEIREFIY